MKQILTLLTAMSISLVSLAQNPGKVTGLIKDGGNQAIIDAASISLLKANDSVLVKVAVTDKEGNFSFENVKDGRYLVLANSVGHSKVFSAPFEISAVQNTVDVGTLQLVPVNKDLKEVVVTSKKLFIERKIDRTIVNVDAAITNAGTTAMEVLEKSPGVTVDKDGNISLRGKQGVLVMVDGKPTYLNAADLANLLKSMPSASLDQIEIMTNPPAKYDAAGNSGVINIKTKKNKQKGFNGSISTAYGQGVYGKTQNSLSLNYRNNRWNVFSNFTANYRKTFDDLDILRKYKKEDQSLDAIFEQNSFIIHDRKYFNGKVGADYSLGTKTTLGVVFTGYTAPELTNGMNTSFLKSNTGNIDSIVTASSNEDASWKNGGINLNFRQQFDSAGQELTADIDYINYRSGKEQYFKNTSYQPDWSLKSMDELTGELPSNINIYSAKVDYTLPLKSHLKMEAGLKSSYVKTDNTASYFNIVDGDKLPDYEKTNHFIYKENINAAYVNFSKEVKKWGFQAGLRLENTHYTGNQFGNQQRPDSAFDKTYTGLFPTMFVSYNANANNQFSLSYGRRINRPDYEDLNPFLFFIDKYTYEVGNPFLKPSYANTFELTHTFKQFLTTSFNYTHTKDLFSETFRQKEYATILSQGNFGQSDNASLSITAQITAVKWWTIIAYTEGNYSSYKGNLNGERLDISAGNFLVNINNQFKFNKGWSAELSGFYRTKGIEGQIIINELKNINIGVQKQVLKNKGTVKLNIRDIFYQMKPNGNISFQRTDAYFSQQRDSRVLTVSFMYRFGKPIKGAQKRKAGGAGDEENRVKSAGN